MPTFAFPDPVDMADSGRRNIRHTPEVAGVVFDPGHGVDSREP